MNRLLLTPSFAGLVGWIFGVSVFILFRSNFDYVSVLGWIVIGYVGVVLALASVMCRSWFGESAIGNQSKITTLFFLFCTLVAAALIGTALQLVSLGRGFGGFHELIWTYWTSPLDIRASDLTVESIGTQITYVGWPAVFIGLCLLRRTKQTWVFAVVLVGVGAVFLSNMLFVDRTRPVWIAFMALFAALAAFPEYRRRAPWVLGFSAVLAIAFFVGFSFFTGKMYQGGPFHTLGVYAGSPIVYLDRVLSVPVDSFSLARTFYPIAKVLENLGLVSDVPSQVLEPRYVPYWTNVGTMVEPLYSDGGWPLLLVGVPVLVFGMNFLARFAVRGGDPLSFSLYGSIMFTMLIGFFVPKYVSTAFYVIAIMALVARAESFFSASRRRPSRLRNW